MGGAGSASSYGFFQGEDDGDAGEAHQGHVAEVVDVGPEPRLGIEGHVDESVSALHCGGGRGSLGLQKLLHAEKGSADFGAAGG